MDVKLFEPIVLQNSDVLQSGFVAKFLVLFLLSRVF